MEESVSAGPSRAALSNTGMHTGIRIPNASGYRAGAVTARIRPAMASPTRVVVTPLLDAHRAALEDAGAFSRSIGVSVVGKGDSLVRGALRRAALGGTVRVCVCSREFARARRPQIVVDMQNDFMPPEDAPGGGAFGVPEGGLASRQVCIHPVCMRRAHGDMRYRMYAPRQVVRLVDHFVASRAAVFATRDYHPWCAAAAVDSPLHSAGAAAAAAAAAPRGRAGVSNDPARRGARAATTPPSSRRAAPSPHTACRDHWARSSTRPWAQRSARRARRRTRTCTSCSRASRR